MVIADLPDFSLNVDNAAQAAVDFLRLDQHIKVTNWIADHLIPPANRVPLGRTIPVSDIVSHGNNRLTATIDLSRYDIDQSTVESRCTIGAGSFVRLSPYSGDPYNGQTLGQLTRGGKTCRIDNIDWQSGQVTLSALWMDPSRYTLLSTGAKEPGDVFDYATIDENASDFVAGRVDERLRQPFGVHMHRWLDPQSPQIPPQTQLTEDELGVLQNLLESLTFPNGSSLAQDQITAALSGLGTRIQLLQGPPGTGKTMTTALAALTRIVARRISGDIILIAAHTPD